MRTLLTLIVLFVLSFSISAQRLWTPAGLVGTVTSPNTFVGLGEGNSAPEEMLHVFGNIRLGDYNNVSVGEYKINVPGGRGGRNGGNGINLYITAGASDNQSTVKGGNLYLQPGIPTAPSNNYGNVFIADLGGKVGVGTTSPAWTLDVNGTIAMKGQAALDASSTAIAIGDLSGGDGYRDNLYFYTHDAIRMSIDGSGNVGIGTAAQSTYKLAVEGKVGAREVIVTVAPSWPDYVFSESYKLPTLETIERYIKQNKHLPEMPSAKDVEANGIAVGEINALLLKKVEELTLYMIELKKENDQLRGRVEKLEKL